MMGQTIRAGTAFTQILLDEKALETFISDPSLAPVEEEEEEKELDQSTIDQELYGVPTDACALLETQMNMVLPNPKQTEYVEEEEAIELVEI